MAMLVYRSVDQQEVISINIVAATKTDVWPTRSESNQETAGFKTMHFDSSLTLGRYVQNGLKLDTWNDDGPQLRVDDFSCPVRHPAYEFRCDDFLLSSFYGICEGFRRSTSLLNVRHVGCCKYQLRDWKQYNIYIYIIIYIYYIYIYIHTFFFWFANFPRSEAKIHYPNVTFLIQKGISKNHAWAPVNQPANSRGTKFVDWSSPFWWWHQQKSTPPKFNGAPEKRWLEDYFPIGKVTFQGLC